MKKGKILTAILLCIVTAVSLSSCAASGGNEDETGTVHFDSADEAFEAMTGAVLDGEYQDAVRYYQSGASDADNADTLNWYYYSLAVNDYEKNGCIGYPLELLQDRVGDAFELADEKLGELQIAARNYNGVFTDGGFYIYIADGKIAVGNGEHLTGDVFCTGELVKKDDTYYWAEHHNDGADKLMYTITLSDGGIYLAAVDGASDNLYEGTYQYTAAEMPVLHY